MRARVIIPGNVLAARWKRGMLGIGVWWPIEGDMDVRIYQLAHSYEIEVLMSGIDSGVRKLSTLLTAIVRGDELVARAICPETAEEVDWHYKVA